MEQKRSNESQQEGKSTPPSKCPRCGSSDIKFRYYNNYSHDQARYYCKTCQRAWTEGGVLRDVPFRGKIRNNEATSSRSGNPTTQAPQLSVPTPNQTMFPQGVSQVGSYYYHDEVSCLNAIQFLIQPPVIEQHVNVDNQLGTGGSADVARPQEWNIQAMASQQALPQQNLNHLYNSSLVQPNWPMNHLPHDVMSNVDLSTSNAGLWDNSADNTGDVETDTTEVDVDQWLNLDDNVSP